MADKNTTNNYMKDNLIASLREAIATKPHDKHTHDELAAFIRRQDPTAKEEVDAIMRARYNPPPATSNLKSWVHPLQRNKGTGEKKSTPGQEAVAAEVVSHVVGSDTSFEAIEPPVFVQRVPSDMKVMNPPKPKPVIPTTDIDPEKVKAMDLETFLDFFKTAKAIREYALAIGIASPKGDNISIFEQVQQKLGA